MNARTGPTIFATRKPQQIERTAIESDAIVLGINLRAEFVGGPAIDRHAAGDNDLFAGAPGGDTGFGEKFLEADFQGGEWGKANGE